MSSSSDGGGHSLWVQDDQEKTVEFSQQCGIDFVVPGHPGSLFRSVSIPVYETYQQATRRHTFRMSWRAGPGFLEEEVSPARQVLVQMKRIVKGGRRGRKGECGAWVEVVVGRGLC